MAWIFILSVVAMTMPLMEAQDFTTNGCGTDKGCFTHPSNCTGAADCDFYASWVVDPNQDQLVFHIAGDGTGFVAIGFSKSGLMRDSDVYACTQRNEVVRSRNTESNTNVASELKGVSDVSVNAVNGRIECQFTRNVSSVDNDDTYFDLRMENTYRIIMSKANGIMTNGNIDYHFGGKAISSMRIPSFLTYEANMTTDGDACGTTKGCFKSPNTCSGKPDCDFFLSWTKSNTDNIVFEMSAMATTYVALGFSKSGQMRDSDVYACTSNDEVVRSRNTVGNTNDPNKPLKGVSDVSVSVVDGRIECSFTRQASGVGDDTYYDLRDPNKYTIIMSKSSRSLSDGNIGYHEDKVIGSKTSFNEFSVGGAEVSIKLILQKAHGCLMMIAWAGLASIGITLARYFKPMYPDTQVCGKPIWFTFHRICMVLTFICTVSAFVIIFISVEGFLEIGQDLSGLLRFLHAVCGTVVTCLAIINPIMAIFRPHPGEPRRSLFNWAHWAVGTSAHLIAMATICLALGYRAARSLISGLPDYLFWLMIGFIIFHIISWILLHIRRHNITNRSSDASNNIPLDDQGNKDSQENLVDVNKPTAKDTRVMTFLLLTYVLVSLAVVAIVVVNIALL